MSTHDSSQPGSPRRKLVLRKITTLGPLPEVKPPPRPSMPALAAPSVPALATAAVAPVQAAPIEPIDVTDLASADEAEVEPVLARAYAEEELETPTSAATVVIPDPRSSASFRAAAIAAMARNEAVLPPPMPSTKSAFDTLSPIPRSPSSIFFPSAIAETPVAEAARAAHVEPADLYGAILKPMPTVMLVDAVPAGMASLAVAAPPARAPMFDTSPSTPVPPQASSRVSVLPFVASVSVPPPAVAIGTPVTLRQRIGRMPAFVSRGGWLAAAVLVVVMGVVAGEQAALRLRAAAAGPSPSTPVATVAVATPAPPPPAVEPAAAIADPSAPAAPAQPTPVDLDSVIPEMAPIPTIVLRSDPPAPHKAAHAWTVPAKAPTVVGAADGWTVAPSAHAPAASAGTKAKTAPASGSKTASASDDGRQGDGESLPAAESVPAPPHVDPLVQAIRDDIREDESQK